eukprot:SAG31_NODE_3329_length_4400_cov_2.494071_7_plen_126_part_00
MGNSAGTVPLKRDSNTPHLARADDHGAVSQAVELYLLRVIQDQHRAVSEFITDKILPADGAWRPQYLLAFLAYLNVDCLLGRSQLRHVLTACDRCVGILYGRASVPTSAAMVSQVGRGRRGRRLL